MTTFLYICGALAMAGFALNNTQEPLTGKNLLGVLIVAIGWPYWLALLAGSRAGRVGAGAARESLW